MTIVLAHTPSTSGEAASDLAIREAALRGTTLVIANVRRGGALVEPTTSDDATLQAIRTRATEAGVQAVVETPTDPDVVDALLELVGAHDADAIVIGLRRRSPVGKLLMGSTAQRLLLESACPVIAVKPA